ncbi:hypothetical protein ACHAXS_006305, partial [Conticribra weissflogii]
DISVILDLVSKKLSSSLLILFCKAFLRDFPFFVRFSFGLAIDTQVHCRLGRSSGWANVNDDVVNTWRFWLFKRIFNCSDC